MQPHHLSTKLCWVVLSLILIGNVSIDALAAEPTAPDADRVAQIAAWLPESPRGVGPTIDQREAWEAVGRSPRFNDVLKRAEALLKEPVPELPDDLYLDYSRTGNRERYQNVMFRRHGRLPQFVVAECIEDRGRFLPAIEAELRAMCAEKAWTLPAHDGALRNFKGVFDIDLNVAAQSWNLATAAYWLGEKLSPQSRDQLRKEIQRRCFDPFLGAIQEGKPRLNWLTVTNNWNAVCLAGVTGAALASIESRQQRAVFVAAAEKNIRHFLAGFTADGYCSEGMGYWNYGFGHYVLLAETLHQASGGKLDLLADPAVRQIALFGPRMEVLPGIYPAFADCHLGARPDVQMMAFLSRRFGLGMRELERRGLLLSGGPSTALFSLAIYGFPNSATTRPASETEARPALCDWFADAGILVCRPAPGNSRGLGVALKGGHNAEHHNHNDLGSFLVALGKSTPLVDPGSEVYTSRTFSGRRYESNVLNSFGHPVPRVAGKLQRPGRDAQARILKSEFTDQVDTLVMDLRSAYDVPQLKKLQRTFVFSRQGRGSLTVTDEVEFSTPQSFGTALITFSPWKQLAAKELLVGEKPEAVAARISTDSADVQVKAEQIHEDLPEGRIPTRLGIELVKPVERARMMISIGPAE